MCRHDEYQHLVESAAERQLAQEQADQQLVEEAARAAAMPLELHRVLDGRELVRHHQRTQHGREG